MKRLFSYFALLLTLAGAILMLLQSLFLVELRFGLFPFTPQFDTEFSVVKRNVDFIQQMTTVLLMLSANEVLLLWLLVVLNIISRRQGLIFTLTLVILIGLVALLVLSAF